MNPIQDNVKRYIREGGWGERSILESMTHDQLHLSKLTGALAEYLELRDHFDQGELNASEVADMQLLGMALKRKLAADLAIFAARFAEYFNQDLDETVNERMKRNRKKKFGNE